MAQDQLDDRRATVVEKCLLALEDARDERLLNRIRLRYLFERDPATAARLRAWLR